MIAWQYWLFFYIYFDLYGFAVNNLTLLVDASYGGNYSAFTVGLVDDAIDDL